MLKNYHFFIISLKVTRGDCRIDVKSGLAAVVARLDFVRSLLSFVYY